MAERPTGTVTFLFTDIEGSTRLLHELGDRYRDALEDHRRLVREAVARHGGHEVDTQGDAFFVAFPRAQDAARVACDTQRALEAHSWPEGHKLKVRMGIHTCEAAATDEGYVGLGVHRGARICAAGHGGQVLLSHTTRDLLEEEDTSFGLRDLGEHRLKDLSQPQRLYQLAGDGLPFEFPPLKTLENRPTNLPIQPTPLVGREREVSEVAGLLKRDDVRLVTLTGPGGTGKTRLSLQAGADVLDEFPDGVFFVPLAPIADPDLVIPSIAQTLGINEAAGQSLLGYLAGKRALFVLDNLEQVLSASVRLGELLGDTRDVKLLATSREPLRLAAEHVYPVEPLPLPDLRHLPPPAALSQYDAVALFIERAEAVQPSFEVTSENAPAVAEVCVRLDGLPLALELAAARITLLSPEAMLQRLGERLKLLTAGARDLPARQQTLRDTIAWSHDLLDAGERTAFVRMSVFAGGFTLDAAEAAADVELDVLASLVDKSLARRTGERFTMLETIREYALERLAAGDEHETLRDRHATFFEALAEDAYAERLSHEVQRSDELERDHDNLRAALDRLRATDAGRALRLAGALGWFWYIHSHFAEGRARLDEALIGAAERNEDRGRALGAAGQLAARQGDVAAARVLIDEAVSIWRDLGREQEIALALHELGWGNFFAGEDDAALRCMEESLALQRALGGLSLVNRAQLGVLQVLVGIGEIETVARMGQEALELAQQLGDKRAEQLAYHFLADCPLIAGDCEAAEDGYRRSLEAAVELGDRVEMAFEVQGLAMAAGGKAQAARALRLGGAAAAELDSLGIDISGVKFWNELLDRFLGPARAQLGARADAAWQEGRNLAFERAIEEALALEPQPA